MIEKNIDKAARLIQKDATWLVTSRLARAWISPKNQTSYRPFQVLVMDAQADRIRQMKALEDRPEPNAVLSILIDAMRNPVASSGRPMRPARVIIDDSKMVHALTVPLAGIGVTCAYQAELPLIDAALRDFEERTGRKDPRPDLLSIEGVTPLLLEELFSAASFFYREAPWRWIDDRYPLEICFPADGPSCYAVIMGNAGLEFGLALFPSIEDLRIQYSDLKPQQIYKKITTWSLTFGNPTSLTFDDLDAIEKYGWAIPSAKAYPLFMKVTPRRKIDLPKAAEIMVTAAALRSIPGFVAKHERADFEIIRPARAVFSLSGVYGNADIALRYPVGLWENQY